MPRVAGAIDAPQVGDPATPAAGRQFIYFKADGNLYTKKPNGSVVQLNSGAAATITVEDENVSLGTAFTKLDFQGAGVSAAVGAAGEAIVTVPGGVTSSTSAGLPTFTGRNKGDTHFNTTDNKQYVLTGDPGYDVIDTFSQADNAALIGYTQLHTQSGTDTWTVQGSKAANTANNGFVATALKSLPAGNHDVSADVVFPNYTVTPNEYALMAKSSAAVGGGYRLAWTSGTSLVLSLLGSVIATYTIAAPAANTTKRMRLVIMADEAATANSYYDNVQLGSISTAYLGYTNPAQYLYGGFRALHQDTNALMLGFDNFTYFVPSTQAWVATTAGGNTAYAGIPSLFNRVVGDQHLDTSTGRGYVFSGAHANATDSFTRANNTALGTTETGGAAWLEQTANWDITTNKISRPNTEAAASWASIVLAGVTTSATSKVTIGVADGGLYIRNSNNSPLFTGYFLQLKAAGGYNCLRNGIAFTATTGAQTSATGTNTATEHTLIVRVTTAGVVEFLIDGTVVCTFADPNLLTGTTVGYHTNASSTFTADDLSVSHTGTAQWQEQGLGSNLGVRMEMLKTLGVATVQTVNLLAPVLTGATTNDGAGFFPGTTRVMQVATTATLNNTSGIVPNGSVYNNTTTRFANADLTAGVYFSGVPTTARVWVGFTNASVDATQTGTNFQIAAFRYDTAIDGTTWKCVSANGGATTVTSTSVTILDGQPYKLRVAMFGDADPGGGRVEFWINDKLVATHTGSANLPTNTLALGFAVRVTTLAAAIRAIFVAGRLVIAERAW